MAMAQDEVKTEEEEEEEEEESRIDATLHQLF